MESPKQKNTLLSSINPLIYLDSPATTMCDPRVFEKMSLYFCQSFGNAHSKNHAYGWAADEAVSIAKTQISDFFGIDNSEVIFTSGATEANILAIRGVIDYFRYSKKVPQNHIITTQIEHESILSCCRQVEEEGGQVTYLKVSNKGLVDPGDVYKSITNKTAIVSVMAVNNEIGTIQPIEEIGEICAQKGVAFHSDVTQAVGKMEINFKKCNIGLASMSGHKIYGPKGIGALFVRRSPLVKLRSIFPGGGQQRGIRGGTLPVPLCVGLGEAFNVLAKEYNHEILRIFALNKILMQGILGSIPLAKLNGDEIQKVPHISNLAFPYVEGESVIMGLENVCLSTASACSSTNLEPSHVLKAINADEYAIQSSIRFGIHRFTTQEEIEQVIKKLASTIEKLREMSPLWEMYKEGIDMKSIKWI
ncbi:MAG: aminotransferase class V-fold PLP-dependent enzyme [Holosporales bacterium]|jgi:cysteine desulfurase|nr:aminotransferase class V-fold PLP-dependent enzyme [Holosporales bacterium]